MGDIFTCPDERAMRARCRLAQVVLTDIANASAILTVDARGANPDE
jgi:hypothetical protein